MNKRAAVMLITAFVSLVVLLQINPTRADAFSAVDFRKGDANSFNQKVLALVGRQTKPPTSAPSSTQFKPAAGLNKEVVGYYTNEFSKDTASQQSLNTYSGKMAGVATFSYQMKGDGTFVGAAPAAAIKQAHQSGGKAVALIHNCVNGSFDRNLAHAVITSPALRAKAVQNLVSVIKANGFDGVNVDLEDIPAADRAAFTQFISEIATTLHDNGYSATISVPAKTADTATGWGGAFDYQALGQAVDRMMLMTYDEHWIGGAPGPVASVGWVENVLRYATNQVPENKLLLGLGMYGYDWEVTAGKGVRALSAAKALQVANQYGATINWDNTTQVPYFNYTVNGVQHVVWFESNNSAAFKMNLVNKYNLAGVAVWKLGFEDSGFWQLIDSKFASPR